MKFSVPQFIDTEDKIFILLTLKQAIYLAGGIGFALIIWKFVPGPGIIRIIIATIPISFGIALAFVKYNKRPFIFFLEAAINFLLSPKRYIWRKRERKIIFEEKIVKKNIKKDDRNMTTIKKSRIDNISRNLNLLNK